jgi:AcrR family transcriptional regulator
VVTGSSLVRDQRRAASEAAILDAAWDLFARRGPDGASLRDVAAEAGCTHGLVARYHHTKIDLVGAVAVQLGRRVDQVVRRAADSAEDPLLELLGSLRSHRTCQQLLVRSALGDLPPRRFPGCLHLDLLTACGDSSQSARFGPDRRSRLLAYSASSLLLGFVTFEEFLLEATGLTQLSTHRRDVAVADVSRQLLGLTSGAEPRLTPRDLLPPRALTPTAQAPPTTSHDALLRSAVELFARRGPASVSLRDIAVHAGVNQGLIHRHFGTKQALLAGALEQASAELFPAGLAADGFDFEAMSWLLHHRSAAPKLIARTLVDDVEISSVRQQFPILGRLIAVHGHVPGGSGPGDLSDPRVAVMATAAMALGSAIWGDHIRRELGLGERDGIDAAIADLARVLIGAPLRSTPKNGTRP